MLFNYNTLQNVYIYTHTWLYYNLIIYSMIYCGIFETVLKAIDDDSSTVPGMLTDYILRGEHWSI